MLVSHDLDISFVIDFEREKNEQRKSISAMHVNVLGISFKVFVIKILVESTMDFLICFDLISQMQL